MAQRGENHFGMGREPEVKTTHPIPPPQLRKTWLKHATKHTSNFLSYTRYSRYRWRATGNLWRYSTIKSGFSLSSFGDSSVDLPVKTYHKKSPQKLLNRNVYISPYMLTRLRVEKRAFFSQQNNCTCKCISEFFQRKLNLRPSVHVKILCSHQCCKGGCF